MSDSIGATLDHLRRVVERRDLLTRAAEETLDALLAALTREPSRVAAAEAYRLARAAQVTHAARRISEATGYSPADIAKWAKRGVPEPNQVYAGFFPVAERDTNLPDNSVATVYVLFAGSSPVYIGRSRKVRDRMRTHWRDDRKRAAGIDRWWVMTCSDDEMVSLEARLIREHQPLLNVAGKRAA